jgi:hypothetical protein
MNGRGAAGRQAQGNTRRGPVKDASIDLATEAQALRERHGALLSNLPADLRRLDGQALPMVERLPALAQIAYLTTVEDYPRLGSFERSRLRSVMQGLAGLPAADRDRFVTAAAKQLEPVQGDAQRLKEARSKPHDTLFGLLGLLTAPSP